MEEEKEKRVNEKSIIFSLIFFIIGVYFVGQCIDIVDVFFVFFGLCLMIILTIFLRRGF